MKGVLIDSRLGTTLLTFNLVSDSSTLIDQQLLPHQYFYGDSLSNGLDVQLPTVISNKALFCANQSDLEFETAHLTETMIDGDKSSCMVQSVIPDYVHRNETIWVSNDRRIWQSLASTMRFTQVKATP